jgi:hypothetical protein
MTLPCGIRNYSYAQDMAILRTKTHWALLIAFLAVLFTVPLYFSNYWLDVLNLIGITLIAAVGLNILVGYCGQLSIGHAGFIAVGAYTGAILTNRFEMPFLVGLLGAGIVSGVVGLIFGLPSVRVKGFYLAITTIAAQFIIIWVINHWGLTGGFNGIPVPSASIGGLVFRSASSLFYLIIGITVICVFVAKNLARTRVGRAFRSGHGRQHCILQAARLFYRLLFRRDRRLAAGALDRLPQRRAVQHHGVDTLRRHDHHRRPGDFHRADFRGGFHPPAPTGADDKPCPLAGEDIHHVPGWLRHWYHAHALRPGHRPLPDPGAEGNGPPLVALQVGLPPVAVFLLKQRKGGKAM